ncbi:MAG TPA: GNAT family N-acetyltransferase [Candidatus Binataceae bacterium]|nr:GNAT family N-acetyltransferase [Candidatus Binataceae bacterium]
MWAIDDLSDYSASAILRDGTPVRIRAIRPDDKEGLARHLGGLSSDSRYHRFFGVKHGFTSRELRYFTEPDFLRHVALVVTTINHDDSENIVSDGRYVALEDCRSVAEVALSVVDAYQRKGVGKLLLECLIGLAQQVQLNRLEADVMASNRGAMRFLVRRGFKSTGSSGGVCRVALSVQGNGGPGFTVGRPSLNQSRAMKQARAMGQDRAATCQPSPGRIGWTRNCAGELARRRGRGINSRKLQAHGDSACQ